MKWLLLSGRKLLFLITALLVGLVHYEHVWRVHENNLTFSHLSELEREMSLRTELGFYYSFYKRIVLDPDGWLPSVLKLTRDRKVMYPEEVNSLNLYNIYPEVFISGIYKYMEAVMNISEYRTCHMVVRGVGLSHVYSCVGPGEPIYVYLNTVWIMAGVTLALLYIYASLLCGTMLAGVLSVVQYMMNHEECTRVQWSPNQRENFAQPFLLLQMLLVSLQLRRQYDRSSSAVLLQLCVFVATYLSLLMWQFSQFVFLTQLGVLFLMEQASVVHTSTLLIFLHTHLSAIHMTILTAESTMLKTSLYISTLVVMEVYCFLYTSIATKNKSDVARLALYKLLTVSVVLSLSVLIKLCLSRLKDDDEDSHIYTLLLAKFTSYSDFHSKLYTCLAAFSFLPPVYWWNITRTGLLPLAARSTAGVVHHTCGRAFTSSRYRRARDTGTAAALVWWVECARTVDPAVVYNVCQMFVFSVLAMLVMRLKLLFTPHLCIVASLITCKHYRCAGGRNVAIKCLVTALLFVSLYNGVGNIKYEHSQYGEFNDIELEQLMDYIKYNTSEWSAFAGPMPIMATVLLTTGRPVVNHPHYESKALRERTYNIYKIYSKVDADELYHTLMRLRVTYLVVYRLYCYKSDECSMLSIWDAEMPHLVARRPLCWDILRNQHLPNLYLVYTNSKYLVYRLHEYSVQYKPPIVYKT